MNANTQPNLPLIAPDAAPVDIQCQVRVDTARQAASLVSWPVKLLYTAFMAVLVPVYWTQYGPANFLYFCDVALFLTLIAVWTERPVFASMAAVGILLPQAVWVVDFVGNLLGLHLTGMTDYMFDGNRSLFLRGLSLFHGWLPFLLAFLVWRLGYDRRAIWYWTALAWSLVLISYLFLPAPGAELASPLTPRNINYVYGISETTAQTWMPQNLFVVVLMISLLVIAYLPTHWFLKSRFASRRVTDSPARTRASATVG